MIAIRGLKGFIDSRGCMIAQQGEMPSSSFGMRMAWKADQLQCALFTLPNSPQPDAAELWNRVERASALEGFQKPGASPASLSFAHGRTGPYRLVLQATVGRIDVAVSAPPRQNESGPSLLEDLPDALETLSGLAQKLLESTKVARLSLIGNFSEFCATDSEVSTRLSELCGNIWFPDPPLDCIYQMNVRRKIADADGIEMNRVMTWTAGSYQILDAQLTPGVFHISSQTPRQIPIVSFKADINTATNYDITTHARPIYNALQNEMLSVINTGIGALR